MTPSHPRCVLVLAICFLVYLGHEICSLGSHSHFSSFFVKNVFFMVYGVWCTVRHTVPPVVMSLKTQLDVQHLYRA